MSVGGTADDKDDGGVGAALAAEFVRGIEQFVSDGAVPPLKVQ
jgi:hypothetical protein